MGEWLQEMAKTVDEIQEYTNIKYYPENTNTLVSYGKRISGGPHAL